MAIIPTGQQFHTLSSSVNTTERGSAKANANRESYTMQDVIDTVAYDAGSVETSGTPAAGWNTRWESSDKIGGQWVADSYPTGGFPGNPIIKGYRSTIQWPTDRGFFTKGVVWMTGYPIGNMDPWLAKNSDDCRDFLALELCGAGPGSDVPFDFTTVANRFADNIVIASKFIQQGLTDTATFNRENVIIGAGRTGEAIKGNNCQENVWIGYDMWDGGSGGSGLQNNISSTVIIGSKAFDKGSAAFGTIQYGVYIGREVGSENTLDSDSKFNVHIGYRASGGHVYGGSNVCNGRQTTTKN